MSACKSECDCGQPWPGSTAHTADCNSRRECDEGLYCDKHFEEASQENAGVLRSPIGSTYEQDMIDAGRGHLLPDVLADRIDMARLRMKEGS